MWHKWIKTVVNDCPVWRLFGNPDKTIKEFARVEVCPMSGRRAYLLARDEMSVKKRSNGFSCIADAVKWCESELGMSRQMEER